MGKVRDYDAEMDGAIWRADEARKLRDAAMRAKGGPGAPAKKIAKKKTPVKGASKRSFANEDNMARAVAGMDKRRKNLLNGGRNPELAKAVRQINGKKSASAPKKLSAKMKKKIRQVMLRASHYEMGQLEEALKTGVVPDDPFIATLLQ
jgi:hypothetical protein